MYASFGLFAFASAYFINPEDWYMLGLVCVSALVYSINVLFFGFRDGMKRVVTDPFVILIASFSLYFLFGPLLLVFGSEEQISKALKWYPANAIDAVQVTSMNFIGLAILLFVASTFDGSMLAKAVQPAFDIFNKITMRSAFWLFTAIGSIAFGIANSSDDLKNGSTLLLSKLLLMAILLGTMYRGRGEMRMHSFAIVIMILASTVGLLNFSKSDMFLPFIVLIFGLYLRSVNTKLIILLIVIMFTALGLVTKPTIEARVLLGKSEDTRLISRPYILQEAFLKAYDDRSNTAGSNTTMWSRLSYITAQVASVDFYDQGQGGKDLDLMFWVFVPRIIYPDKPIITWTGNELNEQMTGSYGSSTGVGLFVGGYYCLGWPGVILVSVMAGWILSIFATVSRSIVASGVTIGLPVGLFGNFMAFRIDGYFVGDFLGPFAMIMMTFLTLLFILHAGIPNAVSKRA